MSTSSTGNIGYWGVVAIGVGGMVGGGIFAVLGLAVELAQGGTPVAFALAGLVAILTTYSYAKLSVACPTGGGTVSFLDHAFGSGVLTGSLNVLLWLSYMVMLSLYAYAFGSYGAAFLPPAMQPLWKHLLISLIVVMITGLNMLGADLIAKAESWIVGLKVAILFLFVALGLRGVQGDRLALAHWSPPLQVMAGGMIIFLAYEGFELIANAAQDVRQPRRTLPRAYYSAVVLVILLYVLVAVVTVGNLPLNEIVAAKDYALAEAARPFMGSAGFTLIAIAALLSTASAINATLYGATRLSYAIAKDGELPAALERKVWNRPIEGLFITSGVTLLVANLFDLSSISTMGSAGFLLIFAAVNGANARLARRTHSRRWISLVGMIACLGALAALLWHTVQTAPGQLWVLATMVGIAWGIEASYRLLTGREIRLPRIASLVERLEEEIELVEHLERRRRRSP
ncbi:MAG: APC family permease [Acidobacteria bacterium]|nr:MAG: APC family permease [Acidobacteriota bacterium]